MMTIATMKRGKHYSKYKAKREWGGGGGREGKGRVESDSSSQGRAVNLALVLPPATCQATFLEVSPA